MKETILKTAAVTITITLVVVIMGLGIYGIGSKILRPSKEEIAIQLAESYVKGYAGAGIEKLWDVLSLGQVRTDVFAQGKADDIKGVATFYGWQAQKIEPDLYFVSFTWKDKDTPEGLVMGNWFEVNTKVKVVRNVVGDPDLKKKYYPK